MTDEAKLVGEIKFSRDTQLHIWREPSTGLYSVEVVTPEKHIVWLVRDMTKTKLIGRFGTCLGRIREAAAPAGE